ncbi:MAG: glycosyltransferase family 2 protein [Stellaceae bacterium]
MIDPCEITILMPCLNEAETLAICIRKALDFLCRAGLTGEVLVADNGSTDGSREIAASHGARVWPVAERGYGSALLAGIGAARGKYVIMGDSDDSYDFSQLGPFVEKLREGFQLVMGNRFAGGIFPGAMPPLHRYVGNPVLTAVGRLFFHSSCKDFHCGLRGFDREAILQLDLQAPGMEFASEMVVKATIAKLSIAEVPTTLSPDGRTRPPHLRSWHDGWRHLRFLLLFSPRSIFFYPGFTLTVIGLAAMIWLLPHSRHVGRMNFDVHTLLFSAVAVVIGFQSMEFWVFSKIYGMREGILPADPAFCTVSAMFTVEIGLLFGGTLVLTGLALAICALSSWGAAHFGPLSVTATMRLVIPSSTAMLLGFQVIYSAFFVGILQVRASPRPTALPDLKL